VICSILLETSWTSVEYSKL